MELLSITVDKFAGIHVRLIKTYKNKTSISKIYKSIDTENKTSIYFYIPESVINSKILEYLQKKGYKFHRYDTTAHVFIYYLWIGGGPDKVPTPCTSILGAQVIIRSPTQNKVLMIKEKIAGHILWKLPTGAVNLGESMVEGALRKAIDESGAQISNKTDIHFVGGYTTGSARPGSINNQFACFEVVADNLSLGKNDGEALSVKWVSRKKIDSHVKSLKSKNVLDYDHHFIARTTIDGELYQWLSLHFISTPRERQLPITYFQKSNTYLYNGR